MYDIYYFSLTPTTSDLPGLLVTSAPRKADRHRQRDYLAVLLTLVGRHPLDEAGQKNLVLKLVETYYSTSKTITAGMRQAVEVLNNTLLEFNRNGIRDGWSVTGLLNLAIQHEDRVYVVNIGPTHTFFLGHHDVYDWGDNGGPRGLGLSNQVNLRYYSESLEPGDLLVFSPAPPASWTPAALQGSPALTFDHLRRRLINQAGPNLQAGVIQFKTGVGEIHAMRLRPVARPVVVESQPQPSVPVEARMQTPASESPEQSEEPISAPAVPSAPPQTGDEGLPALSDLLPETMVSTSQIAQKNKPQEELPDDLFPEIEDEEPAPPAPEITEPSNSPTAEPVEQAQPIQPAMEQPISRPSPLPRRPVRPHVSDQQLPLPDAEPKDEAPQIQNLQRRRSTNRSARSQVAGFWLAGRAFRQKTARAIGRLFWRTLPVEGEQRPSIPVGWLWFIAVVVPLLVAAIALTIYSQLGKGQTQQTYLQQARQVASQAMNEPDLAKQRELWDQSLQLLTKAEDYGQNTETRQLRTEIDRGMDELDKVKRINFIETMRSALADTVNITRMVPHGKDLYALDENSGAVLHFVGAGSNYEVDETFVCRPQNYGGIIVNKLVDLMPLANGIMAGSTILAVDETGNLLYCGPDQNPIVQTLTPPDQNLGRIAGIAQSGRILLVLDKGRNMIWRYGDPTGEETESDSLVDWSKEPKPYFQETIPSLANVVDLVVVDDYLYMIDQPGVMVDCSYSAIIYSPTACHQPSVFEDPRPGRENKVSSFEGALFSRLTIDPLNRQSLYALDVNQSAVYRFSLKLFLDKVFEPDSASGLPGSQPTAFLVTNNQYLVLAFGNRLFVARP